LFTFFKSKMTGVKRLSVVHQEGHLQSIKNGFTPSAGRTAEFDRRAGRTGADGTASLMCIGGRLAT